MTNDSRTPSDIHPSLAYDDAPAAIEWLCRAFGFTRRFVVPGIDGRVEHSELTLGTGVIMVSSPKRADGRVAPRALCGSAHALSVYVPDPDAHHAVALAAGARIVRPWTTGSARSSTWTTHCSSSRTFQRDGPPRAATSVPHGSGVP